MPRPANQPGLAFHEALAATGHLVWKDGLRAVKPSEGGDRIAAADSHALLGGAVMDDDCRQDYPTSPRWDYVIGYRRGQATIAYFIEVHSANPSGVTEIEKKWQWLRDYLQREPCSKLAKVTREVHWVASGKVDIPKNTPQYKRLQATLKPSGLNGPHKHLTLA